MRVLAVETIALQSVDDDSRLDDRLEVCEADKRALSLALLARHQSERAIAREGPEHVRDLTLGGVSRQALDVDCV